MPQVVRDHLPAPNTLDLSVTVRFTGRIQVRWQFDALVFGAVSAIWPAGSDDQPRMFDADAGRRASITV